jgi:hypothetical protein
MHSIQMQEKQQVKRNWRRASAVWNSETGAPYLRMDTDPVSETLRSLVFIIPGDGQSQNPQ